MCLSVAAVMENSTEERQEGGGANTELTEEEEKTHKNLKGARRTPGEHFMVLANRVIIVSDAALQERSTE